MRDSKPWSAVHRKSSTGSPGGGRLEVEHRHHPHAAVGGPADRDVAAAVVAVQQLGPQPVGRADGRFEPVQLLAGTAQQRRRDALESGRLDADGSGSGQHMRGQGGRPIGVPGAKAGEPVEGAGWAASAQACGGTPSPAGC